MQYRNCFSIPRFRIGKIPIPGSRWDWRNIVWAYTTTAICGHWLLSSELLTIRFTCIGKCDKFSYIFSYWAHYKHKLHNIFLNIRPRCSLFRLRFGLGWPLCAFTNCIYLLTYLLYSCGVIHSASGDYIAVECMLGAKNKFAAVIKPHWGDFAERCSPVPKLLWKALFSAHAARRRVTSLARRLTILTTQRYSPKCVSQQHSASKQWWCEWKSK